MAAASEGTWQDKAAAKRASILAAIPERWRLSGADIERASGQRQLAGAFTQQFLEPTERFIVSMDSVPIVDAIREGKLSSLEVATAFCKAAAIAHQVGNCLHEILFDQALARAKELDDYYARNGTTVGPLHGLPMSLKDQFHIKGVDTSMGYVGWIGKNCGVHDSEKTHKVESQITRELLSQGAILYCKTAVPQTLMLGETVNNMIGATPNPHNRLLACGGSSGGEGALQALRGSTLGLGTDIAGSVRIPAAFNGLFGLKPTPERLSYRDVANTNPGQTTYRSSVGFISTSVDGVALGMESVLGTRPWERDPAVVPIPWRREVADEVLLRAKAREEVAGGLKFGVLWNDGVVTPHPPISRGMKMVVDAIEKAGYKVVEWKPPFQHGVGVGIHDSFVKADGANDIHKQLEISGEPLLETLQRSYSLHTPADLLQYQEKTVRGLELEAQYSDYWNSTGDADGQIIDAIIMPVAPHAAVIPGKYHYVGYTEIVNLLNYSAAVIPVTAADRELDPFDNDYEALNGVDEQNWHNYDPEVYHNAPVGVQIVCRKFEEEKAWALAKVVSELLVSR
ncbi:amidase [Xylariaceae sp. FL0594]|nr:amidase [Xylariaceae sp. FL0594]